MQKKGGTKKSLSPELKHLKALRDDLDHIRRDLDETLHKPFWKLSLASLLQGIVRGIGFVFGTTVITAAAIYLFHQILDWSLIGESIQEWIKQIILQG